MHEIWNNIMQHPMWAAFFASTIGVWGVHEIYCSIFPVKRARNRYWESGEIGFKARDPDDLFRACEGEDR